MDDLKRQERDRQRQEFDKEWKEYVRQASQSSDLRKRVESNAFRQRFNEEDIERVAQSLRKGPCPICKENKTVDAFQYYELNNYFVGLMYGRRAFISCRECARAKQKSESVKIVALGFWGMGCTKAPYALAYNIQCYRRTKIPPIPSEMLYDFAKLYLVNQISEQNSPDVTMNVRNPPGMVNVYIMMILIVLSPLFVLSVYSLYIFKNPM